MKITWAVFAIVWIIGAFTAKQSLRRQSWSSGFVMVAIVLLEYFLLFWGVRHFGFAYSRFLPDSVTYLCIGLFITFAGVIFAIWARVTLGGNWSGIVTVKRDHELIRTGPYALVRHPIYTGIAFAVVGTVMFDGEIKSIIVVIVMLTVFARKMKIEERFMTEQFGSEYASYRQKTKALVPFLW